jgi:N-acetylglucosaminyldiphosphoundecaprenol N-acetyl-beta-D-mannosaminyltransferase
MATLTGYRADAASILEAEAHSYWIRFFNIRVNPLSDRDIERITAEAIRSGRRIVIANQNMHSVYLSQRDRGMCEFYESASYVHIDGMPLILLANLLGIHLKRTNRTTSLDFIPLLAPTMVRERWRLFYLGSRPGIAEAGARIMRKEYPGLQIRTHHGYVNEEETAAVLQEINDYRPHILMVGMGMPLQERWIQQHRRSISANVIFPVGAFMDYKAAVIPTPPRWLASFYLEWMCRLVTEPRRLWRRYLVEPWWVLAGLVQYSLKHRGSLIEISPQILPAEHVENSSLLAEAKFGLFESEAMTRSAAAASVKNRWGVDAQLQPTGDDVTGRIR